MRIKFITSSTNAVSQYRIRHPMRAMADQGHECSLLVLDKEPRRVPNTEFAVDLVVLGRQTSTDLLELIDTLPASHRPKLVYEVDDDPWEWHSWDPVHQELGANYARRVTEVMDRCDAITCSTRTLAARIRREMPSKPIWVVPNSIDYQYRDWTAREDRIEYGLEGKIVLGWTGSIHHMRDVPVMLEAMSEILSDYPEAVFLMQCDPVVYGSKTRCLKKRFGDQVRWSTPVAFDLHPRIYSLFDINLAPMEMTSFNLCKSDLRLIEGGAQGVPYVASKIAPYVEFHEQSGAVGGHLAGTVSEWVDAIESLLDGERVARGQTLARYVQEHRSLSVVAGQWQTAFEGVLAGGKGQSVGSGKVPGRNDPCPCDSGKKYKRCHSPIYG